MADDDRSRFSLSRMRDSISDRVASLRVKDDADVRSRDDISRDRPDSPTKPFTFQQEDFDRTEAPKDEMRKYWRQFETTPIVRKPITSFASQVTAPGYYIKARGLDEDELRELDKWLQDCAIIEGETGKDFRLLAKKATVQREVRGTALIEKAPDKNDPDKIAGLKLINPETMEAVTRPGQSILMAPEDIEREDYEDVPEAEAGGAAAYLQDLSEANTFFGTPVRRDLDQNIEDFKIGFRRDEIIKLTRDADVGEIFGTSRIEAVSDRIEGIQNKLHDNDQAIESKAYPLWLFLFGSEENPWESGDISEFMRAHEMENFHPGMKQGVRGDVSVETISGEVADISQALEFDINWIMSAMPMPKFALGAFDGAVGQVGGMAQQQDVNRQINEARREIEEEFTPLLRDVARQQGIDDERAEDIRLKIGKPGEPETEVPQRENIIRYIPENERRGEVGDEPETEEDDGEPDDDSQVIDDGEVEMPPNEGGIDNVQNEPLGIEREEGIPEDMLSQKGTAVWHIDTNMAQLSMSPDDSQAALADHIHNTMVRTREETLNQVEQEFGETPIYAVSNFENIANTVQRRQMRRGRFRDDVEPIVDDTIRSIEESLGGGQGRFSRSQNTRFYVQDIENSTEDAIEEMLRLMRIQVRRAVVQNDDWEDVRKRVEIDYDDSNLRQRAELIAHMELKNARETTRLQQWEANDEVIGVRVSNEDSSTPLTQSLHGAEAYFDEGDIGEQLMEQTREQFLHEGFNPLPPTPPFHFQDTSTLEPIYR